MWQFLERGKLKATRKGVEQERDHSRQQRQMTSDQSTGESSQIAKECYNFCNPQGLESPAGTKLTLQSKPNWNP